MNQFQASLDRLRVAQETRYELDAAYAARPKNPVQIAYLNDQLRHNMAMSRMHAHLAEVQALYDLRGSVDTLFQALTADPEPDWAAQPVAPALELVTGDQHYRCANCQQATFSGKCPDCKDGLLP